MSEANKPAFGHGDPAHGGDPGLTKREYFAGLAMQGWLASWPTGDRKFYTQAPDDIAEQSVRIADALLKALEDS